MICCDIQIIPFVAAASSTIPYTGDRPTVTVSYFVDGVWQALGYVTNQTLTDTDIIIDHGGPMTGVIKIVQ